MRRIDWAAYARTEEPVLKLFRAEEDVIARIVCDASASSTSGSRRSSTRPAGSRRRSGTCRSRAPSARSSSSAGDGLAASTPVRGRAGLAALLRASTA